MGVCVCVCVCLLGDDKWYILYIYIYHSFSLSHTHTHTNTHSLSLCLPNHCSCFSLSLSLSPSLSLSSLLLHFYIYLFTPPCFNSYPSSLSPSLLSSPSSYPSVPSIIHSFKPLRKVVSIISMRYCCPCIPLQRSHRILEKRYKLFDFLLSIKFACSPPFSPTFSLFLYISSYSK